MRTAPRRPRLVVVGDALLDRDVRGTVERLSPDAPVPVLDQRRVTSRPGGAALAAALAAADGSPVALITALSGDQAGDQLRTHLRRSGVELIDLETDAPTPVKTRLFAEDRQLLRLDDGQRRRARVGAASAAAKAAIGWAGCVLVSDYGHGVAAEPGLREALRERPPRAPVVWDPHPRGPAPTPGVTVATPNEAELRHFSVGRPEARGFAGIVQRAEALRRRWRSEAVCVTRGARGAVLVSPGSAPIAPTAPAVHGGDSCGAGDRFASSLAAALAGGQPPDRAVSAAIAAASSFVAAGGAGEAFDSPRRRLPAVSEDPFEVAARVRDAGGTVVATGGCFDLLHAGHVSTVSAARALGDCLIVCLNSDASVRRLKGSRRPLVDEQGRTLVLAALACVDAVAVFDEDTPSELLRALRPDVWAKGGDYSGAGLPEADVLREWGGQVVLLPYVDGHSTSKLIAEAASNG